MGGQQVPVAPCEVITVAQHSYFAGISVAYNCIENFTYVLFVNCHFFYKIGLLKDWNIYSLLLAGASCSNIIFMDTYATVLCVKSLIRLYTIYILCCP